MYFLDELEIAPPTVLAAVLASAICVFCSLTLRTTEVIFTTDTINKRPTTLCVIVFKDKFITSSFRS